MKIEVDELSLTSKFSNSRSTIVVEFGVRNYEDILLEIWDDIGEDGINEILLKEGKILIDVSDLPEVPEKIEDNFDIPTNLD